MKKCEYLNADELERLLGAADTDRDRTILRVLANTGVRVGELCGLSLGDINWSDGILRIKWLKNRDKQWDTRTVPIRQETLAHLKAYLAGRPVDPTSPVFGITVKTVQRMILGCGRRAHLGRVTPHTMRHTFTTALIEAGATVAGVAELLGHKSIQTTMGYFHASAGYKRREYDKVSMAI